MIRRTLTSLGAALVALLWALSWGLPAPSPAFGQTSIDVSVEDGDAGDDYDTESRSWNGLSTLTAIARGSGLVVEEVEDIDWDEMSAEDILFLMYPTRRLEPGHVAAFVRNGGHVMIADDFGDSSEALGRLGMLRGRAIGVSAETFYRGLQHVPMARPLAKSHPLAARVDKLATNHPSILKEVTGPEVVFGFGSSEAVVVAGQFGDGKFIVCSDPSVFINRMLQFQGNVDFAFNVMRYLKREGTSRRLIILTGDFSMYGEPTERFDDGTVRGTVGNMVSDFNRWLDERNDYLLTRPGMRAVAIIAAILIGLLVLLTLPVARKSKMEGEWTRAPKSGITPDDFEEIVSRYDRRAGARLAQTGVPPGASGDGPAATDKGGTDKAGHGASAGDKSAARPSRRGRANNFLLPATILRDSVFATLERITELHDLSNIPRAQILETITFARGQMASSAYQRMHRRLNALPSRLQAASPWSTGFVSRRDFERLHEDAMELYLALGEEQG